MLTLQLQAMCLGQLGFYVNYQSDSLSFASSAEESICGAASLGLSGPLTAANLCPNFPQHIAPPSSDAMLAGIEGTRPNLDMGGGALGRPHRKPRRPEPRWRSGVSVTSAKKNVPCHVGTWGHPAGSTPATIKPALPQSRELHPGAQVRLLGPGGCSICLCKI